MHKRDILISLLKSLKSRIFKFHYLWTWKKFNTNVFQANKKNHRRFCIADREFLFLPRNFMKNIQGFITKYDLEFRYKAKKSNLCSFASRAQSPPFNRVTNNAWHLITGRRLIPSQRLFYGGDLSSCGVHYLARAFIATLCI